MIKDLSEASYLSMVNSLPTQPWFQAPSMVSTILPPSTLFVRRPKRFDDYLPVLLLRRGAELRRVMVRPSSYASCTAPSESAVRTQRV